MGLEEKVEVNPVMKNVKIFDVYYEKDKILVLLQQVDQEPITFMIQGVSKPKKKKKKVKKTKTNKKTPTVNDTNTTSPAPPAVPTEPTTPTAPVVNEQ